MILVTGGAGFIGSNFVLDWLARIDEPVLNLDKLTYAGNLDNLASSSNDARHMFVHGDIGDRRPGDRLLQQHQPRAIVHFAAESHVDRSIHGPAEFIKTNVNGTFTLLEAARAYWNTAGRGRARRHFVSCMCRPTKSTARLAPDDPPFTETTAYAPNSPYSASKAASDHLVRAYHHTYGLPTLTTNCSNNYGPYPFPGKADPADHRQCAGRQAAADLRRRPAGARLAVRRRPLRRDPPACSQRRRPGETYNIGGWNEKANLDVVHTLCDILDQLRRAGRAAATASRSPMSRTVPAMTAAMRSMPARSSANWAGSRRKRSRPASARPCSGISTIRSGWQDVQSGDYMNWIERNYDQRDSERKLA